MSAKHRTKSRTKTASVAPAQAPELPVVEKPVEPPPLSASGRQPLLGLVMIVKNEAHGIAATLQTLRPFIEEWTILDTGSTDGTQEIIRQTMDGVPGRIIEDPFVDFSTSRNRALEIHGERTIFTIMPDSDDRLVGGDALRAHLLERLKNGEVEHEAYLVNIRRGELSYFLPLVMRTSARWRYSGRVHECSGRPGGQTASVKAPGVVLSQDRTPRSLEATRARWVRDLDLLEADFAARPEPRTAFYLAQTLDCLGRTEEALAMYEKRIELGGWIEETFEARLRRGHMMKRLGRPWPEVQQAYLDAHTFDKRRAEPLYAIADYYYYHAPDNLPMTFLFARRAAELPAPNALLFVDRDIYDWKAAHLTAIAAFYLDEREIGAAFAAKAVKARPGDDLLRNNRSFYARSASETFGATTFRLPYAPAEPFVAANPSVHFDGEKWRCLVRTLNYRIIDGCSYEPPDGVIQTHNVMLELTSDLDEIVRTVPMKDLDSTSRTSFPVHGFEDCRLFTVGGKLYCTATVCDFSYAIFGLREIVLLELGGDYAIIRATPLRGQWSLLNQKNWMPIETASGKSTKIIYSLCPTTVLDLDVVSRQAVASEAARLGANPHLRGGSQLVPFDDGYICLIHDVTFSGQYRTYLHRFVWLDAEFVVKKMSDFFYFQHRGIEYAAGLAYDHAKNRLVASYSVSDSTANLAFFDVDKVMKALREDFAV